MNAIDDLRSAVGDWDRHRTELAQLSIQRKPDWRKQTVQYRRLIQTDIARIAAAMSAFDADSATQADRRAFRSALSAMRSCVAEHQANWPVVGIDPADSGYERSVVNLRAVSSRFADTAKLLIERLAHALSPAPSSSPNRSRSPA